MIRATVIPDNKIVTISLSVPENYIGKEMEIIAFTKKEGLSDLQQKQKNVSFSAVSIDTLGYKFNRDEANER